jgi:hypothetical protein
MSKDIMNESKMFSNARSIVGLFSQYDDAVLERLVGSLAFKSMLKDETKDAFHIDGY